MLHRISGKAVEKIPVDELALLIAEAYEIAGVSDFITATYGGELSKTIDTSSREALKDAAEIIVELPRTRVVLDYLTDLLQGIAEVFAGKFNLPVAAYVIIDEAKNEMVAYGCLPGKEPHLIGTP